MAFLLINSDAVIGMQLFDAGLFDCCVTSPPYYGLRDYGIAGQIGHEKSPDEYVARLVEVFREVKRVLKGSGTLWLNLGDSYISNAATAKGRTAFESERGSDTPTINQKYQGRVAYRGDGLKPKDLIGIPWRVAFALQADGWWLRQDIIWAKPNPMPESVKDRCTKAHEYLFLLTKNQRYYYDADAVKEPKADPAGRNRRSVWTVPTQPYKEAHFATFPELLIEPCILAGCPVSGVVLDPFAGAATTGVVALKANRDFAGIELNPAYIAMAERRLEAVIG